METSTIIRFQFFTFINNNKCYLGSTIPGKTIKKSLGLMSMIAHGVDWNINKELELLIAKLLDDVEKLGGNAIINLRFETGSYEENGSRWMRTYLLIYGEGVVTDKVI